MWHVIRLPHQLFLQGSPIKRIFSGMHNTNRLCAASSKTIPSSRTYDGGHMMDTHHLHNWWQISILEIRHVDMQTAVYESIQLYQLHEILSEEGLLQAEYH